MCVYSNESVLPACQGARPIAETPRVQECGIRSVSVVGVVFLGSDAPCDAWPTMNPRVVGLFPGNQRHPPGPAPVHGRAGQLGQREVLLQGVGTRVHAPPLARAHLLRGGRSGMKQCRQIFSALCGFSAWESSGPAMAWVPLGFLFRELAFPIFWGYPSPPSWLLWGSAPCE